MTKKSTTLLLVPMFFGILTTTPAARAEIWTHVASSCAIDESATTLAQVNAARLSFAPNKTGTIRARCNVVNLAANTYWSALEVVYRDPDGRTSAAPGVRATLYKVHNSNGGVTAICTFDSIEYGGGGDLVNWKSCSTSWNFINYSYYVEISLTRNVSTGANSDVTVSAVRLYEMIY